MSAGLLPRWCQSGDTCLAFEAARLAGKRIRQHRKKSLTYYIINLKCTTNVLGSTVSRIATGAALICNSTMAKLIKMFHKKGESAAAQDLFEDDFLEGRKIPENREKDIVSCLLLT